MTAKADTSLGRASRADSRLGEGMWARALRRLARDRRGQVGFSLISMIILLAILAPILSPFNPFEMHHDDRFLSPSRTYLFGTDEFGRDLFSRVLHGARISISAGLVSVSLAAAIGSSLGFIAGYFGGFWDALTMRLMDSVLAFPAILLAVVIVAILGKGFYSIILAIVIVNLPRFSRLARATMIGEKEKDYVVASISCGARDSHVIFRSIMPNCLAPIVVQMTISIAGAILLEAGLSFLGVGNAPPSPSWGTMLSVAQKYLYRSLGYAIFPGLAITTLLLGLYLFDDALQQAFRTKQRLSV